MWNFNLHPEWVHAVVLLQQEQEPNESGLPFGDDELVEFINEAMRKDAIKAQTVTTTAAVQPVPTYQRTPSAPQPPQPPLQPPLQPQPKVEDFIIDMVQDEVKPEFRFSINGVECCQNSGITAISGQAKHGKSQFLVILASVLLSGRDFGNLKRLRTSESILWIDTEQSKYDIQTNIKRLYHLANIPEHTSTSKIDLNVVYLRDCNPETRRFLIDDGIMKYNPDFVIVDGIRDLVHNFNDPEETENIIQWLLSIVARNEKTNIVCVLHNNPGESKMRGHLGTELLNKCADQFDVKKDNGFFRVNSTKRGVEMKEDFCFCFDNFGNLVPLEDVGTYDTEAVIKQIFSESETDGLTWGELARKFTNITRASKKDAKADIIKCNQGGALLEQKNGKYYLKKSE